MPSKQQADAREPARDERGRLLPGHTANPNGRPKGSKNKFTELKDIFLEALEEVGGKEYVKDVAKSDPTAFLTLIAKMLPRHSEVELNRNPEFAPIVVSHLEPDDL